MIIRKAQSNDAEAILDVTKRAFALYKNELPQNTTVVALAEQLESVLFDIKNNNVYVAIDDNNTICGSIRYTKLTNDLAYIYRFGVEPDTSSSGVGSDLLNVVIDDCVKNNFSAIALHTNSKYYKLARYYYGREFYVHSTTTSKGYIRALFVKELNNNVVDLTEAHKK